MTRRGSLTVAVAAIGAVVAISAAALGVLAITAGAGADGPSRAAGARTVLPEALQVMVFRKCFTDGDIGFTIGISSASGRSTWVQVGPPEAGEFSTGWHVMARDDGVSFSEGISNTDPSSPQVLAASRLASRLYACVAPYTFTDSALPSRRSDLVQLYRYDVAVLWPCLAQHGFDPGQPPGREDFVSASLASAVDPYRAHTWAKQDFTALLKAAPFCPELPRYLEAH